jgi:Tripartite tricarboxylate transporter TctB family
MTRRLNPQILAGLLFVSIGAAFLIGSLDLSYGSWRKIGPGAFPALVAALLMVMGMIVAWTGRRSEGNEPPLRLYSPQLPVIIGAIVVFGLVIRGGGLLAAVFSCCLLSSFASRPFRPVKSALYGLALGAGCCLVFVKGLGMPVNIIGPWFGF